LGINIVPKLITVPGRVLNSPQVKYHNNKAASTRFGSWNMTESKFETPTVLENWTYLHIRTQGPQAWRDPAALSATLQSFTQALRSVGVNAANHRPGVHILVNPANAEALIDEAFKKFNNTPNKLPPKLVLVILPVNDSVIYNRIKYAGDVREGIINVCVVAQKFAKANSQYHVNVALKVNLKLGGQNQVLDSSKLGLLAEGKTMVVGLDVTHPAPGASSNAPSVASIVASVDQKLGQWPAELRIQTGRQEMVADLENLLKSRLLLWIAKHRVYPENLLIYRDGVSEGQYDIVLDKELPALRKACEKLYPPSSTKQNIPRITIIIVGKRHNTRFYPTNQKDADRSSNPQNGTVVDRGVTEARNWDFFLQAHTAIQGTARPAHYYIVYDEIFRSRKVSPPFETVEDVVEDLTHNLCYLYGRATKAVSICPPAYYADLACERARCYLGGLVDSTASDSGSVTSSVQAVDASLVKIHDNVKDTMFYI
jgi:eukaryotic translation initiation factor 2C